MGVDTSSCTNIAPHGQTSTQAKHIMQTSEEIVITPSSSRVMAPVGQADWHGASSHCLQTEGEFTAGSGNKETIRIAAFFGLFTFNRVVEHASSQVRQPAQASGITEIRFGFNSSHHPLTLVNICHATLFI